MTYTPAVAAAISVAATEFGVDPYLLAAIVRQESGGDPNSMRYESAYTYLWDVEQNAPYRGSMDPAKFPAPDYVSGPTEWVAQKTSWGLGQVMGAVAREQGFTGRFLSGLCDPVEGARMCAKHIAALQRKYSEISDVVSSYNAGHPTPSNQNNYVEPVLAFYREFAARGL